MLFVTPHRPPLWTRAAKCLLFLWLVSTVSFSFVRAEDKEEEGGGTDFQISNGVEIAPQEFPWFCALLRASDDHFLCGGAFVGNMRYVLTARHCILNYNPLTELRVEVGYLCHQRKNCGRDSHRSTIKEWIVPQSGGDFVILVLKKAVKLPIQPAVPLLGPEMHPNQQTLSAGDEMTIVGGGLDDEGGVTAQVEKLVVEFVPLEECRDLLSEPERFIDDGFDICSNSIDGNPCKGDSGSALIVPGRGPFEGRDVMVAVHKFGPSRCRDPDTRVYGHFLLSTETDLIRREICQGKTAEDWCQPQKLLLAGLPETNAPMYEGDAGWFTAIFDPVSLRDFCGGVLIGPRHVATVGHCVTVGSAYSAEVGYYCRDRGNCGRPREVLSVTRISEFPGSEHFALLTLERAVSINVQAAVPYLGSSLHPDQPKIKKGLTTTLVAGGFDETGERAEEIKLLGMTSVSRKTCEEIDPSQRLVTDVVFCSLPDDSNPCRGDAGGPLVVAGKGPFEGRALVMGIHSFGPRDCSNWDKPVGHFAMPNAASLIQSVVCDGGNSAPDWCPTPQFEETASFAAILDEDGGFQCSGVLIGARHVLTATFCFDSVRGVSIDVGYYCTSENNCGRPHEVFDGLVVLRFPSDDLTLIVLERAVSVNGIQPAVPYLGPSIHPNQSKPSKGLKMKLVAGGRDGSNTADIVSELKVLNLTFQTRKKCLKKVSPAFLGSENRFCTVPKNRTPCQGDSGGPLLVPGKGELQGRGLVVGMHIAGTCGDGNGRPTVALDISKAGSFLRSTVCDGSFPEDWC